MQTGQVVLRERCALVTVFTHRRRFLVGATANGKSGIPPLARVVRLAVVCGLLTTLMAPPVYAATLVVTTTADTNGVCGAVCSLRAAITAANATTTPDTIVFDPSVFNVSQTITLSFTLGPLPAIVENLDILGPSAPLTVNANGGVLCATAPNPWSDCRVFFINSGVTASISDLRMTGGTAGTGGGIHNRGTLRLTNVTLNNNSASNYYGSGSYGGGIYNEGGALTLNDSTVSGNGAHVGGGMYNISGSTVTLNDSTVSGNGGNGVGGIYNNGSTLTLNNSTLSGNTSSVNGGGIYNLLGSILTLSNSTVSGNTSAGSTGAIWNDSAATVTLKNTIVTNNVPNDCAASPPIISLGHNLDSDGTCLTPIVALPSDLPNTDPMLGPLALNPPGSTETQALQAGSPAIDAVPTIDCTVAADQRGVVRPQDGDGDGSYLCDIGAYEAAPPVVEPRGQKFCISGASTGISWKWKLTKGTVTYEDTVATLVAGDSAAAIAAAWATSMVGQGLTGASVLNQPNCFRHGITPPVGWILTVQTPPGPVCTVTGNTYGCSFNPTVIEVVVPPIPTVSEWGLVVLTLLGLSAGTILLGRRRAAA